MATLRITVPAAQATEYLHEVIRQIDSGCTAGYVDAETHWEVEEWDDEAADDLR
jgi:hypothetical protein